MKTIVSRIPARLVISLFAVAALVVLLLYIQGTIGHERIEPGVTPVDIGAAEGRTVSVERKEVVVHREWPGTVRSRKVASVSPRVMAHILDVLVSPGDTVSRGDVIATLDSRDLHARTQQAGAALKAAEAQAAQAAADHDRMKALYEKEAATLRDLEAAEARSKALDAQVEQARDALREAEVLLGEAEVTAPFDGVVVGRLAEPGDLAVPGRPIVTVQDPRRLRMEVRVSEECAQKASVGMEVKVRIDALDREATGTIDEIVPAADPQSRTFLVKAELPDLEGLRPGMFGRVLQPCDRRAVLLVPDAAVSRVGQLETVRLRGRDGSARQRHVRTGKRFGAQVEILSGLHEGEEVLLPGPRKE